RTFAGPLEASIGRPAFTVSVDKSPAALPGLFTLEWNPDECLFTERANPEMRAANPVAVVSLSGGRTDIAPAAGQVVAFSKKCASGAGGQPASRQHGADCGPRRTGRGAWPEARHGPCLCARHASVPRCGRGGPGRRTPASGSACRL